MRNDRDALLDGWADQRRRLATLEASMILAVDLLMEVVDVLDKHSQPRLDAEIRSFLMNVPVGGRL